jgi:hypothetical protein
VAFDPDYDGRSLYPRQVFFPMADEDEGWARLARNLKAEIDPELIEAYRGTVSLPFEPDPNRQAAVKVIDDRGSWARYGNEVSLTSASRMTRASLLIRNTFTKIL